MAHWERSPSVMWWQQSRQMLPAMLGHDTCFDGPFPSSVPPRAGVCDLCNRTGSHPYSEGPHFWSLDLMSCCSSLEIWTRILRFSFHTGSCKSGSQFWRLDPWGGPSKGEQTNGRVRFWPQLYPSQVHCQGRPRCSGLYFLCVCVCVPIHTWVPQQTSLIQHIT